MHANGMNHLIVMTRLPCEGRNKTRLIPALGAVGAAEFHDLLARHAIGRASSYCMTNPGSSLVIRLEGGSARDGRDWVGECDCRVQGEGDLGARMMLAANEAFDEGARRVVIIGTDCPRLDESVLGEAFDALDRHDLVFGPAADGGYYLIGLAKPCDPVFQGIAWGGAGVLGESLDAASRAGAQAELLCTLPDVDTPEDLPAGREALAEGGRVSVIIPTLNEAAGIVSVLDRLVSGGPHEIIVADGGSSDETVDLAIASGATVIHAPKGRAAQMNLAASRATGEFLLFLHADTLPPVDFCSIAGSVLRRPGVSAGAFRFELDEDLGSAALIESLVRLRGSPYGDQGLFVRRRVFSHLGGYPEWPVMEDLEFVRKFSKVGRVHTAGESAVTSARRWHGGGVIRTFVRHQAMLAAYHLGISPRWIARLRG